MNTNFYNWQNYIINNTIKKEIILCYLFLWTQKFRWGVYFFSILFWFMFIWIYFLYILFLIFFLTFIYFLFFNNKYNVVILRNLKHDFNYQYKKNKFINYFDLLIDQKIIVVKK